MTSSNYQGGEPYGAGVRNAKLNDAGLLEQLQTYKRRVAGTYRALAPSQLGDISPAAMWVTRKIDGETWFLVHRNGEVFLVSPMGRVIAGAVPVILQAKGLPPDSIVAGELYAKVTGRRERVGDLAVVMAQEGKPAAETLLFTAFDGLQLAGKPLAIAYDEKLKQLSDALPKGTHLDVIEAQPLQTGLQVHQRFESEVLPGNSEGLIVRHASGIVYKVKPQISIDAAVVGYTVKADQPDACRSLLLGLCNSEGQYVLVGACGNIGDDKSRREWLERLAPLRTESQVRRASDSGGLYQFVRPEVVGEFMVTDLQGELSDGRVPVTACVRYSQDGWSLAGSVQSPSLIHPVFERIRNDKAADATGVRFAQLQDYLPKDRPLAPTGPLPASALLRREVWTKTTKGQLAVRKLLVWQTNKSQISNDYPAYVVHWTDFSSGRASPLDREVKLAPDEATAMQLAQELIEGNIKKGWEKV